MKIHRRPQYVLHDRSKLQSYALMSEQDIRLIQATRTDDEIKRLFVYHPKWSAWKPLTELPDLAPRNFTLNRGIKVPQPVVPPRPATAAAAKPIKNPFTRKTGEMSGKIAPSQPVLNTKEPTPVAAKTQTKAPASGLDQTQVLDQSIQVTAPLFASFNSQLAAIAPPFVTLNHPWPPAPEIPSPIQFKIGDKLFSFIGKASPEGYPYRVEVSPDEDGSSVDEFFSRAKMLLSLK